MKEIEKKYLVNELPSIEEYKQARISQGYLSTSPEVRIRMQDDECFLTSKGDGSLVREEKETPISIEAFQILYSMVKGIMIDKTRVYVPLEEGYTAELDVYHGSLDGMLTVEVEFPTEEDANSFVPPVWFGKEVTDDKRFKNKNLATSDVSLDELLNKNNKRRELK